MRSHEVAVITGAGSGIGRALAGELAVRGTTIAAVDVDAAALATIASARVHPYVADVSDASQIENVAARISRELGAVDLLVNNAGVAVVAPFAETRPEDWDWITGVNLFGAIRMTRAFVPAMSARGRGHVAFVASMAGLGGAPGMVAYATPYVAVVGFAAAPRYELADAGIGVTVACPGYVRTSLHRNTRYRNRGFRAFLDSAPARYGMSAEQAARRIVDAIDQKRFVVPMGTESIGWWLKRIHPELAFAITRQIARVTRVLEAR